MPAETGGSTTASTSMGTGASSGVSATSDSVTNDIMVLGLRIAAKKAAAPAAVTGAKVMVGSPLCSRVAVDWRLAATRGAGAV